MGHTSDEVKMRILSERRGYFRGTHKGGTLEITCVPDGRFYIIVLWKDGGALYDGWAPDHVRTMREAKKEAVRGACLDRVSSAA